MQFICSVEPARKHRVFSQQGIQEIIYIYSGQLGKYLYKKSKHGFQKGHLWYPPAVSQAATPVAEDDDYQATASYLRLPTDHHIEVVDFSSLAGTMTSSVHLLQPGPARQSSLEQAAQVSDSDKLNSYRIWHANKTVLMFQAGYWEHRQQSQVVLVTWTWTQQQNSRGV